MWIEQLQNGKYRAVDRYVDPLTGKSKKVSVTMEKDTAAQRKKAAASLRDKIAKKTASNNFTSITFQRLTDLYLEDRKNELKPSSFHVHTLNSKVLVDMIGPDAIVNNFSSGIIRSKFASCGLSPKRKNVLLSFLKTILNWAYRNDYIGNVSYLKKIDSFKEDKKASKKVKFLESNQLSELLNDIDQDGKDAYRDLTEFLALTGLRIGEALALTYDDIDLSERTISVNKTYSYLLKLTQTPKTESSNRVIRIQDELFNLAKDLKMNALNNRLIHGTNLIFTRNGEVLNYMAYKCYLSRHSASLGYEITPHTLRHTHTALLAEHGMTLDEISRRLGHEDSNITREIYFHITNKFKEKEWAKIDAISLL